ncbi:MAG: PIG-L family deacetylase [Acidobacteriaceae bacterium]|nr:PIG-L family deacetylase [Acidobacteriaceae bacterium]
MTKFVLSFLRASLAASLVASLLWGADSSLDPKPDARYKADLLVVVAHPDDETEIGAYLARAIFDEKKRVAVVFGTRGNQGGNAEGQEQSAALGLTREIEARQALAHFDVKNVWFLNGTDTPSQEVLHSLEAWDHGDSLGRLVRLVRLTRPTVIATWLPDWAAGENHGDHQAAGVLTTEAFDMAGDPTAFAEQIVPPRNRDDIGNFTEGLRPWQPEKLYFFSDTEHPESLNGKGPAYLSSEKSAARGVSYARLAAEECAFHLTQGDTGQMAEAALAHNDFYYFDQPVRFIFGKSYVNSDVTADLFAGTIPNGIAYKRPPGFVLQEPTGPRLSLGGSWNFYHCFWQAHGLEALENLFSPEMLLNYSSQVSVPILIENPTDATLAVTFSVALPEGWKWMRRPLPNFSVSPRDTLRLTFQAQTPEAKISGWKEIVVQAVSAQKDIGAIHIRVKLDPGAMPQ